MIQKGALIGRNIDTMLQKFVQLKEVFKKQTKQTTLPASELDTRFQELQVIKKQLEECQHLHKRGADVPQAQMKTLTDFLNQMEKAGVAPPSQFSAGDRGGWREPSEEEQAVMSRWAARDKEFDKQIWQVGEGVDRLHAIAIEVRNKAEIQGQKALELSRQADEANKEVVAVNEKLAGLVSSGTGINFCCKLLMCIVLVTLIGLIVQNITDRVKKKVGI